jgi:antitoxin component of RelBE/YafQ-DinJ toxin-antitoxin module
MERKDDRLSLRVNSKLKKKVQRYCVAHGVDMSDLVTRFFERVVAKEAERRKKCRS